MNFMLFVFSSKNTQLTFLFFVYFLLCSCSEAPKKYNYDYLRRQLTPDKMHYVYTYSREGAFVTSNEISGRRLLGIHESFSENGRSGCGRSN